MFATPWLALAGIIAMAIPIVIHLLFRRRRKPVTWGAMRLLIEAINRNRRRSRIQNILLLVARCLVLLLVGFALARPFLSGSGLLGGDSRILVLIIDDGIISGLDDGNGRTELDLTIESATEMIDQLKVGGILVIPVGDAKTQQMLRITKTAENKVRTETFTNFKFVPLLGADGWRK